MVLPINRTARHWSSASGSFDAESSRALYQDRLRFFTKAFTLISFVFWVLGSVVTLAGTRKGLEHVLFHPSRLAHVAFTVGAAGIWAVLARRRFSAAVIDLVDIGLTIGLGASFGAMTLVMPGNVGTWVAPVMIFINLALIRAVIIPSPPRRTFLLTLIAAAPVVAAAFRRDAPPPGTPEYLYPAYVPLWCLCAATCAAAGAHVVYGLRAQVREAAQLGQYTLLEKIGEGGMGAVYRAKHALLRRETAVKLLPPDRASPEDLARFEREVQHTSQLRHPNTIAIYDFGHTVDGVFYYAMEYVGGIDLEQLVEQDGAQPAARVVHVLQQVLGALEEAHGAGLMHRDVKPANVLLCFRAGLGDVAKVVDFGLVKEVGPGAEASATSEHVIAGTPLYLAPESIRDPARVDARADLYALGAVGYYLLTARSVFEASSVIDVLAKHLNEAPAPPSTRIAAEVPDDLESVILRCLEKDPAARPQTAREVKELLGRCRSAGEWTERDAATWWDRRAAGPAVAPAKSAGATALALTIDVRERAEE